MLERPYPIQSITVNAQGSRWIFVTWNIPYNGNDEIIGYVVYIKNVERNLSFIQVNTSSASIGKRQTIPSQFTTISNSYNISENILPFMRYQFTVVACNELGCGEFGQPSSIILTDSECKHID